MYVSGIHDFLFYYFNQAFDKENSLDLAKTLCHVSAFVYYLADIFSCACVFCLANIVCVPICIV